MIDIRLGSIHVGVHFHAHHEAHEVFLHRNTVGITVISLHEPTTLLIGVVIELHFGEMVGAMFDHLFQRSQGKKSGIGVFADNHDLRAAVSVGQRKEMSIEFAGFGEVCAIEREGGGSLVGCSAAPIHADIHHGAGGRRLLRESAVETSLLQYLLSPTTRGCIYGFFAHHGDRFRETHQSAPHNLALRHRIDLIVFLRVGSSHTGKHSCKK